MKWKNDMKRIETKYNAEHWLFQTNMAIGFSMVGMGLILFLLFFTVR